MGDPIPIPVDRHTTLRVTTRNPFTRRQVNITGASLIFQSKAVLNTGATVLFELKNETAGGSDSEIEEVSGLVSGVYRLHISPSNLTGLNIGGTYWCETKMTSGGKDSTIFQEKLEIVATLVD